MIQRDRLAVFLRARRAHLQPGDVGLPGGDRRRTPGLRRQEVAQLAGISIDYYIRIEQGRGPTPSRQILTALARALMLSRDERDYLFQVAGQSPPPGASPAREITEPMRWLLDSMPEVPAYVVDAKYDLLAWNELATHFIGSLTPAPERERNLLLWMFRLAEETPGWDEPALALAGAAVADLRASHARHPGDPGIQRVVGSLLASSARFAELWESHDVTVRRRITKRFDSDSMGLLEFECQLLHVAETGQRLIAYCASPGSPTRDLFRRLAGTPARTL